MYTGDHKTAKLSQTLITDALLTLLETVPFADISVSRLCQQAQVSRQTFYSLFGTKENVLLRALETSCCFEPAAQSGCRSACFKAFCKGYSHFVLENRHLLTLLVRNDMMHLLYEVQYARSMACDHFMPDVTGDDRVYLIDFIASGMNSIAKNFVLSGGQADEAFLERLMYRLFGGMYFISRPQEAT